MKVFYYLLLYIFAYSLDSGFELLSARKKKEKVGDILNRERDMFDLQLKLEIARSERQHLIYSGIAENDVFFF
jgi:hypothetical protein